MSHPLNLEDVTRNGEFTSREEFTSRQRALLKAWDESNLSWQDDEVFERRLLSACDKVQGLSPSDIDAEDREIRRQMTRAAEAECRHEAQHHARRESERERDAGKFHEVAMLHEVHLQTAALRLCGNRAVAQDLVQETLTRALLHFSQFKQGTNVRAWLTTILTRLFLDQRKHEKVATRAGQELEAVDVGEPGLGMAIPSVPDAMLWEAVKALDADLREVVELRYLQGLRYQAIADRLELPVGTVGTRLMRAHERLKDLLKRRAA